MRCWGELLKELKVLVRSVRTSHTCNFRDIVEITVSQAHNYSKSWLRPRLSEKLNNEKALHSKHKVQTNYRFIQTPSSRAQITNPAKAGTTVIWKESKTLCKNVLYVFS